MRATGSWERASFVWMWVSGMSLRAIARRTGASVTTVYRWIRRWQREGHVFTRARGCKPRGWNTQASLHHATHYENACQAVGSGCYPLSRSHFDSGSHVPLNTQQNADMTLPRIPVALPARHSSAPSASACPAWNHEGRGCQDGLPTPLALVPRARTHHPQPPLILPELIAMKDTHRFPLAYFINYLQFHESIHQLQATTGYNNESAGKRVPNYGDEIKCQAQTE